MRRWCGTLTSQPSRQLCTNMSLLRRQELLGSTAVSEALHGAADVTALCKLLELSGRLSTRRDAGTRQLLQVRSELLLSLLQREDSLTDGDLAMVAQVRSLARD